MKFDPQEIRGAMDKRLSFLHESGSRRAGVRQRIAQGHREGVKQKRTAWIALTAITALVVAGVALGVGLNLLGMFSNRDARIGEPEAQTALLAQPIFTCSEGERTVNVYITYAHYDGDSLTIAYTIENGTRWEPFTPSEEQLDGMIKIEGGIDAILFADENNPLLIQMVNAMENGTTAGLTCYSFFADNHTETNSGYTLGHADRTGSEINDGIEQAFRQYTALGLENEVLEVIIHLWNSAQFYYFDGTDLFVMCESPQMNGTMGASILRTDEPIAPAYARQTLAEAVVTQHMSGVRTTYEGVTVEAAVEVSAEYGELTLTASGEGFTEPDAAYWALITHKTETENSDPVDDFWYGVVIRDAEGNLLHSDSCILMDADTITSTFEGNGILPEHLSVSLILRSWSGGTEVMAPLILSAEPVPDVEVAITWDNLPADLSTISPDDVKQP